MSEPAVKFEASMYFRYGRASRQGLHAKTCFDAVVSGERTSTTRFEEDSARQYEQWRSCRPADIVRIWSGPWRAGSFTGRSCLIEITEDPRRIVLQEMNRVAWSQTEGWADEFVDVLIGEGKSLGIQVFYRLFRPPEDTQRSFEW